MGAYSSQYELHSLFYPGWSKYVTKAQILDDLVDVIEPFMRFIGFHVSRVPTFLTKFLRLGRMHLMTTVGTPNPENPIRRFWYKTLRLYLLLVLTLIWAKAICNIQQCCKGRNCNPCILFANTVEQILAYNYLAGIVKHALDFKTIMGFDIFGRY
ncbi:hypothetical protein K474DRAFT_1751608 [Panus rudis PR-1116 ss-1]|nr:hypothetical protein K474DRAFT_1751608 [Panus rudis PR-1116 ss-1]